MVGPGRLELPTLRLSGVRSNHLSYGPSGDGRAAAFEPLEPDGLAIALVRLDGEERGGKRNGDGDAPLSLSVLSNEPVDL